MRQVLCLMFLFCAESYGAEPIAQGYHTAKVRNMAGTGEQGPWRLIWVEKDQRVAMFGTDPQVLAKETELYGTADAWIFVGAEDAKPRQIPWDVSEWHTTRPDVDGFYNARLRSGKPTGSKYYYLILHLQGDRVYRAGSALPVEHTQVDLWGPEVDLIAWNARVRITEGRSR